MLEINNQSILPQIANLNSDALNILFEFTVFKNKYDFTYHYLFENLPYRQSVLLNLISFLVKIGLIKKVGNSNITKEIHPMVQSNIEDITLPKKRGRKKKVVQEKSQNDLLVNENDQLIIQPFTNNIQKDILLLIGVQQKYLDKIK